MNIFVAAPRSLTNSFPAQSIRVPIKRCLRLSIAALILMFAGNAYAAITVGLAIENDLDSNGNITVINGSKVKVSYEVLEDTDKDLNKKDRIELRTVVGDELVSFAVRGKKKSGSVKLKVKNSEGEQLYVRYVRKSGTEIARISHPDDTGVPLLSIAKASLADLTTRLHLIEARFGNGFNVDFGSTYGVPVANYPAASTQAGVWNKIDDASGSDIPLASLLGGISPVTVSVDAGTAGGNTGGSPTSDDGLLLKDNFFASGGNTWTVIFNGLLNGTYSLFIYAPSNSSVPTGDMTINGTPVSGIPGTSSDTLINGTSYIVELVTITNGTLTLTGAGSSFAGLAGIQIVP